MRNRLAVLLVQCSHTYLIFREARGPADSRMEQMRPETPQEARVLTRGANRCDTLAAQTRHWDRRTVHEIRGMVWRTTNPASLVFRKQPGPNATYLNFYRTAPDIQLEANFVEYRID
jgi:hypothetical protein